MKSWIWWTLTYIFGFFVAGGLVGELYVYSKGGEARAYGIIAVLIWGWITYLTYKKARSQEAKESKKNE